MISKLACDRILFGVGVQRVDFVTITLLLDVIYLTKTAITRAGLEIRMEQAEVKFLVFHFCSRSLGRILNPSKAPIFTAELLKARKRIATGLMTPQCVCPLYCTTCIPLKMPNPVMIYLRRWLCLTIQIIRTNHPPLGHSSRGIGSRGVVESQTRPHSLGSHSQPVRCCRARRSCGSEELHSEQYATGA